MSQWRSGALDHLVPSRLIEVIEFSKPVIILISYFPPLSNYLSTVLSMTLERVGELPLLFMLKFNSPFPPSSALSPFFPSKYPLDKQRKKNFIETL